MSSSWPSLANVASLSLPERTAEMNEYISVKKMIKRYKNGQTRLEYGLVARKNIPAHACLGMYSGKFLPTDNTEPSRYSFEVDKNMTIYPFAAEDIITHSERLVHPLANMNEPEPGTTANCFAMVQDLKLDELQGDLTSLGELRTIRFVRGVAFFTCRSIREGEELTWHYGPLYEPHRNYEVGHMCDVNMSKTLLRALASSAVATGVVASVVYPVRGVLKSDRFDQFPKRKRKHDSSESEESFSSGSGHEPEYVPDRQGREERLRRRAVKRARG